MKVEPTTPELIAMLLARHPNIFNTPKRPWVALTAMDIHDTPGYQETREMYRFALAIEAKSKEKNT